MTDAVGVHINLPPDLYAAYVAAASARGITKRRLIVAGLLRELADPTEFAEDSMSEELRKTA